MAGEVMMRRWIFTVLLCVWFPVSGVEPPCIKMDLESLGILKPGMVVINARRLYIFDDAEGRIHLLDKGQKVQTFGSRGRGPDQYLRPARMITVHKKELWVLGPEKNVIFSLKGEWLRSQPTRDLYREMKGFNSQYVSVSGTVHISEEGWVIGEKTTFLQGEIILSLFLLRDGRNTTLMKYRKSLKSMAAGQGSRVDPLPIITVGKRKVYMVKDPAMYKVRIFHMDTERFTTGIFEENGPKIAFSKQQIEDFTRNKEKNRRKAREAGGIPREFMEAIDQAKLPEYQPAITRICADEAERLYILSPTDNWRQYRIRVYQGGRTFLREITIECERPLFFAAGDERMVIIEEAKDTYFLHLYPVKPSTNTTQGT